MSLLFETSLPPEDQKRPARRARKRADDRVCQNEFVSTFSLPVSIGDIRPLGRIDHTYACADDACGAECHDILDEDRGQWLLECCFCGTKQTAKAIAGVIQEPEPDAFRFRDGRYAGQTLDEAAATPRGADYLAWAAESHPRPAVREAVKTWLAKRSGGLYATHHDNGVSHGIVSEREHRPPRRRLHEST
jgi:hypothetical protein